MTEFTDRVFTSSFSGTAAIDNTLDDCTFSVEVSGTITFTLSSDQNGNISGQVVIDGDYDSTVTGGSNCIDSSGPVSGSGFLSGSLSDISFDSNEFANFSFTGATNNLDSLLSGTLVLTFDNTTGQYNLPISATTSLPPVISIGNAKVFEDEGFIMVEVTRSFAGGVNQDVTSTVLVQTQEGSARTDDDFAALSQVVTFAPGETSQFVMIGITADQIAEVNERFSIVLSNVTNANLGTSEGSVTIKDDDNLPGVVIPPGAIVGTGEDDDLDGTGAGDDMYGGNGNDLFDGYAGDDDLFGGAGDDDFDGGAGNDELNGGGGADFQDGGYGDDTLKGGSGDDTLYGGDDDDLLVGGKGADVLDGGEGDDTYESTPRDAGATDSFSDSGAGGHDVIDAHRVVELMLGSEFDAATTGIEEILGDAADKLVIIGDGTAVNWDFTGIDLVNVRQIIGSGENDVITGSGGDDRIKGRGGDDTLNGGDGEDRLIGGAGNDTLSGGAENDVLKGGDGEDTFLFRDAPGVTNVDTILDFDGAGSPLPDIIQLDNAVFTTLAEGALPAPAFESGAGLTSAATTDGRIIYDSTSGALYYDTDGAGGAAAIQFAVLASATDDLSAADFLVI